MAGALRGRQDMICAHHGREGHEPQRTPAGRPNWWDLTALQEFCQRFLARKIEKGLTPRRILECSTKRGSTNGRPVSSGSGTSEAGGPACPPEAGAARSSPPSRTRF